MMGKAHRHADAYQWLVRRVGATACKVRNLGDYTQTNNHVLFRLPKDKKYSKHFVKVLLATDYDY